MKIGFDSVQKMMLIRVVLVHALFARVCVAMSFFKKFPDNDGGLEVFNADTIQIFAT